MGLPGRRFLSTRVFPFRAPVFSRAHYFQAPAMQANSREVWEKILPIQTKSVKSSIPYSPTNVQWSCQTFRGREKKRISHLCKCHPSKWLARVHDGTVFKTIVLHLKIENTPIKGTNGKRKFKRMLSFLFVEKRKLVFMKLFFEEFNLVFYTAGRSAWLVLNQPRQRALTGRFS